METTLRIAVSHTYYTRNNNKIKLFLEQLLVCIFNNLVCLFKNKVYTLCNGKNVCKGILLRLLEPLLYTRIS